MSGTSLHQRVEQALELYTIDRHDQALALLDGHLAEAPDDHEAWTVRARALCGLRRYEEALDAADQALKLEPELADGHFMRGFALRRLSRLPEAEQSQREAIRLSPERWGPRAQRAEMLIFVGTKEEALQEALEAVRFGPDVVDTWHTLYKVAAFNSRSDLVEESIRQALRIDPADQFAVTLATEREARKPGTSAARAADLYAGGLAAAPGSEWLRSDLDRAVYRMLRGTRWLALLCLAIAAVTVDVFTTGAEAKELPAPLGTRLWALTLMAVVWGFGAWRRYRRLRTGAQLTVFALVRRSFWPRVVLGQATWATLCALLLLAVPWSERTVPQVLFWLALVPNLLSITHDRDKV
ncbi:MULTISPECIES: tetratricopeptide repeat protein [Streptomyces]|uniref:Tetratricopeptide repeat protein n=1 Tax=Streptomyces solicathayae TaxID=3081768 RepID=A0ABZ0LLJ1_9ACTN|nr:tetratricopeptide repeat protein [Streptomyces sp. HUAS YS2]WOX20380.1 tetratricopeptide repeat protein [Streptomyces sp. HUAS YS2]